MGEDIKDYVERYPTYLEALDQIDQLKQQLEEKDKEINSLIVDYEKRISQEQELMSNMEHQLAEKDKLIEYGREEIRRRNKRIDEIVERDKKLFDDKNKEIETLKQELEEINAGYDFIYEQSTEAIKELKQNQTQLAIQELEKTKDLLLNESKNNPIIYDVNDDLVGGAIDKDAVFKIINQQISELKGEKDEV